MKIERKILDETGTDVAVAHINLQLEYGDHDRPHTKEEILNFLMTTYSKLGARHGEDNWDIFFKPANDFLAQLSAEDQYALHDFYLACRRTNSAIQGEAVTAEFIKDIIVRDLADHAAEMVQKTDIPAKAVQFVMGSDLQFPDLSNVGNRPHDTTALTFRLPEYQIITAMSVLCKVMSPVWGDFVARTQPYIDTINKEMHCLITMLPILEHQSFQEVYEKLRGYMKNSIKTDFNRKENANKNNNYDLGFTLKNAGFSDERFEKYVEGMLFVKKLALYDPNKIDCDVMKYIAVNIQATINTAVTHLGKSSNTMVRKEQTRSASEGERDGVTQLESESRVSRVSADVPVLARHGTDKAVARLLEKLNIPKKSFKETVAFYNRNIIQMSPYARTIMSSIMGQYIGGAQSIQYLTAQSAIRLASLTQLHMAMHWPPQLVHMLTATYPATPKEEVASAADGRILMNYETSREYKQCVNAVPYLLGPNKSIKAQITANVEFVTKYHHFYNTAEAVADFMDEAPQTQGTPLVYDEFIIQQLCGLIAAASGDDTASV